jgi:hypothetical protein
MKDEWFALVRIMPQTVGRVWIQFEYDGLPFFRIAWQSGPWGLWIGWN